MREWREEETVKESDSEGKRLRERVRKRGEEGRLGGW